MDSTILTDPFVWVCNDVIPNNKCREIINRFEADNKHHQGATCDGVDLSVKNSLDLAISNYPEKWRDIDILFEDLIKYLLDGYIEHLARAGDLRSFTNGEKIGIMPAFSKNTRDIGYQVQKTNPGEGYTWHHDYETGRILTFILYLNTVEEGWTQFYNGDQIAPQAGRCVIFPATWTYYHQGSPPLQTKYIMTGWVYSDEKS